MTTTTNKQTGKFKSRFTDFDRYIQGFYYSTKDSPLLATGRGFDGTDEPDMKCYDNYTLLEKEGLRAVVEQVISNFCLDVDITMETGQVISDCEMTWDNGKLNLLEGFPFGEYYRFSLEYAYISDYGCPVLAFLDRKEDVFLYAFV